MAGSKKNGHHFRGVMGSPYRSYVWKGPKDPAIDVLRTAMQDEGVNNTQMHVLSNVSIATLSNWFTGPTRRPSHAALAAAFAAIGYDYVPQKRRMLNLEDELPKAQRWMERYKAEQQKGK